MYIPLTVFEKKRLNQLSFDIADLRELMRKVCTHERVYILEIEQMKKLQKSIADFDFEVLKKARND